jgi:hypothetical protein
MEAVSSSETSMNYYRNIRRRIREGVGNIGKGRKEIKLGKRETDEMTETC